MLESIRIENFAIIDNTEINFKKGLTVLTGETGAGKTIIIDAIGLLLGERASLEMIRHGEKKAVIEGVFSFKNNKIKEKLYEFGIECEDKIIILRQLLASGNSTLRVNGTSITLSVLREITKYLIDIHLQHDTHRLIDPSNYIEILDGLDNIDLSNYKLSLEKYKKHIKVYNDLMNSNDEMNRQVDYLKYQLEELMDANLSVIEEEKLNEDEKKYKNFDKIYQNIKDAYTYLYDSNALQNIFSAKEKIAKLTEYSSDFKNSSESLENVYYELEEVINNLNKNLDYLDFNPEKLNMIQTRLNEINRLKRKYGKSVQELEKYLDELKTQINAYENKDESIEKILSKIESSFTNLILEVKNIRNKRMQVARNLESQLTEHLKDLHLEKADFKVLFNEVDLSDKLNSNIFSNDGIDTLDFLISTNTGEPLKPLNKTASGGEISRIMLALKTILLKSQKLSTIIFDEIDSGVSGSVAHSIAKKVKLISKDTQVLLITHLPQVAAVADHHLFVSKHEMNGRTISKSIYLDEKEKIYEISKMLSNEKITNTAIQNAKELLNEYN
ncbi:DNA repair protein RecN [Mycoplasmatota bacterium]|nr:DNA repair protein RecN [Mycoplasmatota bacterium]